ncbi:MAG: hypothetical protein V3U67_08485 [Gemmatimonadota bacterium]
MLRGSLTTKPRRGARHFQRILFLASGILLAACSGSLDSGVGIGPNQAQAQQGGNQVWIDTMEATGVGSLPPVGFGTRSQDDITVLLASGPVQIKVVPLEEWVIRLTAPDTYARLNRYKTSRDRDIIEASSRRGERGWPLVAFVTFFTREQEEVYQPFDLQIQSQGAIYRPIDILAISPDFGSGRLPQQSARIALYLFSGDIDLNLPMTVLYQQGSSAAWGSIRTLLDRERSLVLSRSAASQDTADSLP